MPKWSQILEYIFDKHNNKGNIILLYVFLHLLQVTKDKGSNRPEYSLTISQLCMYSVKCISF